MLVQTLTLQGVRSALGCLQVTILFSDIVGFTELSSRWPTQEVVALLDRLFSSFDDICDRCACRGVTWVDQQARCCGCCFPASAAAHPWDHLKAGRRDAVDTCPSVTLLLTLTLPLINDHCLVMLIRHGVFKVETIGDAYMIAAGHDACTTDHALRMAATAVDMLAATEAISKQLSHEVQIRIGMHTGVVQLPPTWWHEPILYAC